MAHVTRTEETLHLTITLPKDVAQHLREEVAKGLYASESEYVQSMLQSETLFPPIDHDELTEWINTEGARRYDLMRADPSRALTEDQVFEGLLDTEEDHD
jgi:Arc/MetJ-type ribon-helix-helix transcriptional regulator